MSESQAKDHEVMNQPVFDFFTDFDVILGRGNGKGSLKGNMRYRALVKEYKLPYMMAKRKQKSRITKMVFDEITSLGGRFLEAANDNKYVQVPYAKVLDKISQALREKKIGGGGTRHLVSSNIPINAFSSTNYPEKVMLVTNSMSYPLSYNFMSLSPSNSVKVIQERDVRENDILYSGRGRKFFSRPANKLFMDLLKRLYHESVQKEDDDVTKRDIAREALRQWKGKYPPGRFLNAHDDGFHELDDLQVIERLCQSLRDLKRNEKECPSPKEPPEISVKSNPVFAHKLSSGDHASHAKETLPAPAGRTSDMETACILALMGSSHHRKSYN